MHEGDERLKAHLGGACDEPAHHLPAPPVEGRYCHPQHLKVDGGCHSCVQNTGNMCLCIFAIIICYKLFVGKQFASESDDSKTIVVGGKGLLHLEDQYRM